jgi:hypothetical protein
VKRLGLYLITLFFCLSAISQQQITIGTVNPGPYGKGSSVMVPFRIDGNWCGATDNKFELWISPSGFTANDAVKIGTYNATWARFINGLIPANYATFGSHSYKVVATSPVTQTISTGTISIVDAVGPDALVKLGAASASDFTLVTDSAYGSCGSNDLVELDLIKASGNF